MMTIARYTRKSSTNLHQSRTITTKYKYPNNYLIDNNFIKIGGQLLNIRYIK